MKKVGIVTIHKINNYGALEQAYALNRYIRSLGFETKTIDFRTYRVAESYQLFRPIESIMDIPRNLQTLLYYRKLRERNKRFAGFLEEFVPMTAQPYYSNEELKKAALDFDYYICGSDQIWNTFCKNYDDAFLLAFARGRGVRISYAASLGAVEIHENLRDKFRYELSEYRALSVRESNAVDVISSLSGKNVAHVCDPVFLLGEKEWSDIASAPLLKKPYIFLYIVKGDIPGIRDYAHKLGKETGMKVVVVNMNLREMQYPNVKKYDAGPQEFVSLIQNAAFVCTNSFHATAFSVIFKKKFMVFSPGAEGGASRLYSLLEMLDLTNRIYGASCCPIETEINYPEVYKKLLPFIENSKEFLHRALEKQHETL